MKLRIWLQSAGVAALVLFFFYFNLLDMHGDLRMHTPVSVTSLALSLVANLILVSLITMLMGIWLRSSSKMAWLRFFVPAIVLASITALIYVADRGSGSFRLWATVLVAILFVTLVLHWSWQRGENLLLQFSGAALVGLGFFCIFVLLQLVHLAMWRQLPTSTTQAAIGEHAKRQKIVWILFDELSYQQTFGDRYPDLQMPNFDAFRKSSTLFTDTLPIANQTERAIPSILLGESIARVNYTSANRLEVGRVTGAMFPFDAAQTPFALARQYGLTTGVAGWYNPYCGMLAPYLNQCYWTYETRVTSVYSNKDFWQNFSNPWIFFATILGHPAQIFSRTYRARLVTDVISSEEAHNREPVYRDLMQHADRMLGPSGPDFVFLHLPLPHPPGFYNRKTRQFEIAGQRSYIDNLALTDLTLGRLLTVLEQSPRWKDTSVIISGDHSWRVYIWAHVLGWTAEDQAASHGAVFDPRPMLMIHLAGQTMQQTVSTPFPLLRVHTILNDLVEGNQPSFSSTN